MFTLETRHVTKLYDDKKIIDDISIQVKENEIISLLGVSGSGKTTLFNVISGLLAPDSGEIFLDGINITGTAGHVSYMLQKDLLLPYRTIEDNVSLPLLVKGMKKKAARSQVAPYFKEFDLDGTQKQYPAQISGGMRQRAALLRTYMFSQKIALLDEPFSALDTITKSMVHQWYLDIMERIQLTTIFITHDIDEAILLSDRIYIMTGSPGVIKDEIIITQTKPRNHDFNLTDSFLNYKRQIIRILEQGTA